MKMSMKRILCLTSLMALSAISSDIPVASAAGAEASSQEKPAASVEVKIDNFSFGPQSLTVTVGTKVTWTNRDDIPHNVVADDKSFKSKVLDTDEKFSYTFTKAGNYPYFCGIHPHMTGKVIVQ
jgi:plastocyanin